MKHKVRLNKRAFNERTGAVNERVLWEVEQCLAIGGNGRVDSERVVWHCANVRIDGTPVSKLFRLTKAGEPPWELEFEGWVIRGQDDAIEIHTGVFGG